jgi:hypothetical protein
MRAFPRLGLMWSFALCFGIIFCESAQAEKLYASKGKRDPFVPLVTSGSKIGTAAGLAAVESVDEIVIEGLMFDSVPKNSVVVVNGSVLKEGDEVGNVKVLKIRQDGAQFSVNGIEGFKPLYQDESKN